MPKPLTKEQNKVLNEVYYEDGVMVGRDRLWEYMKENYPKMKILGSNQTSPKLCIMCFKRVLM